MVRLTAALWLALAPAGFAADAPAEDIAMVEAFLKMPTAQMPAEHIPRFLAVPTESLPKGLQGKFRARCLELYTLKQITASKKRGVFTPEDDCAVPKEAKSNSAGILRLAGFEEIQEDELHCVKKETNCPEITLLCEFSLQVMYEPALKKEAPRRRLFLHKNDPLMAVVGKCRNRGPKETHFFGLGGIRCVDRGK